MIRARPIGGALTTLDVRERQISVLSNFINVFTEEYGLSLERNMELSIDQFLGATPV